MELRSRRNNCRWNDPLPWDYPRTGRSLYAHGPDKRILIVDSSRHRCPLRAVFTYDAGISAAYNLWPVSPVKWLLRRFDQSAIYLLIAASYTPFISQLDDSSLGNSFLIAVFGYCRHRSEDIFSWTFRYSFHRIVYCHGLERHHCIR